MVLELLVLLLPPVGPKGPMPASLLGRMGPTGVNTEALFPSLMADLPSAVKEA